MSLRICGIAILDKGYNFLDARELSFHMAELAIKHRFGVSFGLHADYAVTIFSSMISQGLVFEIYDDFLDNCATATFCNEDSFFKIQNYDLSPSESLDGRLENFQNFVSNCLMQNGVTQIVLGFDVSEFDETKTNSVSVEKLAQSLKAHVIAANTISECSFKIARKDTKGGRGDSSSVLNESGQL